MVNCPAKINSAPMSSGGIFDMLGNRPKYPTNFPASISLGAVPEAGMKDTTDLMIVDDSFRARQALTAYLSQQDGVRILAQAADGLQAIDMLHTQTPDVILLDVQMPVMDGIATTKAIKKNWPWIKVIILTLYPDHESRALAAGADAFLVKGCSVDKMMSTIWDLVPESRVASARKLPDQPLSRLYFPER
jgi:CheY-like chemotaxis protein